MITTRPPGKRGLKKIFLILLSAAALAIFITPARVFAYGAFSGQNGGRAGKSFFLFADETVSGSEGGIMCVKSRVVAENLNGDAYAVFSELEIFGNFDGQARSFFSKITVHTRDQAEPSFVRSFFWFPALGRWTRGDGVWVYDGVPPGWALSLMGRALRLAFVLFAGALKKGFFAQGAAFLLGRPLKAARNGLLFCFGAAAVAAVFALSAVGVPMAMLAVCALAGVTLLGEVSLGLAACKILFPKIPPKFSLGNNLGMYAKIAVGVIIIELARLIPYFVYFADWLLLPVLCSGAVITALYEGLVKKVFLAYD